MQINKNVDLGQQPRRPNYKFLFVLLFIRPLQLTVVHFKDMSVLMMWCIYADQLTCQKMSSNCWRAIQHLAVQTSEFLKCYLSRQWRPTSTGLACMSCSMLKRLHSMLAYPGLSCQSFSWTSYCAYRLITTPDSCMHLCGICYYWTDLLNDSVYKTALK